MLDVGIFKKQEGLDVSVRNTLTVMQSLKRTHHLGFALWQVCRPGATGL